MDRLDRVEKILEKVAKSQADADRQRAKDKAVADAEAKRRVVEEERRFAAAAEESRELRRQIKEINSQLGHEGGRMGEIAEAIVANDLPSFMEEHFAIEIKDTIKRIIVEHQTKKMSSDIDVLGINSDTVVAVEVKTTIALSHIYSFKKKIIDSFYEILPTMKGMKLYAGVAFIKTSKKTTENDITELAEEKKLFVMKIFGKNNTKLVNSKGFALQAQDPHAKLTAD